MQSGQRAQVIQTSAAKTSNNNSSSAAVQEFHIVNFYINVTAISGTSPNLAITIQDSPDGNVWYPTVAANLAITAIGQYRLTITDAGQFARAASVITGTTPSITYDITAVGVR